MPGPATDLTPSLLHQAEALRDSLSSAVSDTRDLIGSIKRDQKQNRLVETTLRSLKQMEHIGRSGSRRCLLSGQAQLTES
jgi:hypothetical protein